MQLIKKSVSVDGMVYSSVVNSWSKIVRFDWKKKRVKQEGYWSEEINEHS